jgi:hypothetical protein
METKRSSEEGNKESEGRKLKILSMYEESFWGQDKPPVFLDYYLNDSGDTMYLAIPR